MKTKPIEKIIMCDKCNVPLWKLRILSHFGETLGAHEYEPLHAKAPADGPDDEACPVCSRDFMTQIKSKNGNAKVLTFWNEETKSRENHLI